jgi:hypothetical protein
MKKIREINAIVSEWTGATGIFINSCFMVVTAFVMFIWLVAVYKTINAI